MFWWYFFGNVALKLHDLVICDLHAVPQYELPFVYPGQVGTLRKTIPAHLGVSFES